ncbi:unnamed protein product [Rotaria socialis]|uniref:Uncharacterized protein n=1 Tax=Rotaria socialis TaxID=392032 RepID=A0A821UMK4_9BILA|nr:unnamed protein product [Rotaria socialis]CAF4891964.1 unnamed protein product [Rotaria socialis]
MSDSCHHEKSDSTNPTSTSDAVKMNKKIDVKVGNDQGNISFTTIKTDAVGPCHSFLLTGAVSDARKILLGIDVTGFQFNEIHKLQMLGGGSVPLYPNRIHNGFLLVNNVYTNMQIQEQIQQQLYDSQLHQRLSMHLIKQLKGNIKILPPITCFTPDPESDEEEGK